MKPTTHHLRPLLEKTARRMTSLRNTGFTEVCPIGIIDFERWEWPQGVGLYGLLNCRGGGGASDYVELIRGWFDRRLAEGLPAKNVNTMAPLLTLAHLCEFDQDAGRLALCTEWAEWVMHEMPRTREGGLQHIVSGEVNDQQLWSDTLFMTVLFLAKMGRLLRRHSYVEEAIRQFLVHIKFLADRKTGLWFHGWTFHGHHNFSNARWARGNCWITASTVDFLEMGPLPVSVRLYLRDMLTAQVEALALCQAADGMWHTLLDDPSSYVETSATAGFGYGILKGVRCGHLDSRFAAVGQRALAAVIERIDGDGTVQQVSYGTGMGADLEHYKKIPLSPMAYGQALAILLLNEGLMLAT